LKSCTRDPGRIRALASDIGERRESAEALAMRFLARIEEVDSDVRAWREVDAEGALQEARALDAEARGGHLRGPLHGIPVAVKDIIDVCGLPTRAGSRALEHVPPASADAEVVATLRAAGALVLGKVHTTEFAFLDPAPTRNPHHLERTPGGSSSGSAAAVAAGSVPAALGTQTAASVNRPAAYCGIAAFKPSTGATNQHGIAPLAPLYDTVGCFGWSVADALALLEVVCPEHLRHAPARPSDERPLTIVQLDDPILEAATPVVRAAVGRCADQLAEAGHRVLRLAAPVSFGRLLADQWRTMQFEMSRVHRALLDQPGVGSRLRAAIEEGLTRGDGEHWALRARLAEDRRALFDGLGEADAVLWPATPAVAPGLDSTGDPRFIAPWTALGGPLVSVPVSRDEVGLPIGVLLAGAPGADWAFRKVAERIAGTIERAQARA